MYKSPISITERLLDEYAKMVIERRDNEILAKVQSVVDVDLDKAELLRALQYDRDQYETGYADGKRDVMDSIVRCKDCKMRCPESVCIAKHCTLTGIPVDDDDFCSYGERRGDGI